MTEESATKVAHALDRIANALFDLASAPIMGGDIHVTIDGLAGLESIAAAIENITIAPEEVPIHVVVTTRKS